MLFFCLVVFCSAGKRVETWGHTSFGKIFGNQVIFLTACLTSCFVPASYSFRYTRENAQRLCKLVRQLTLSSWLEVATMSHRLFK